MHAVSAGISIMYSPYLATAIFAIIHFIAFLVATLIKTIKKPKSKVMNYVYLGFMVLACILNIMLLFSGSVGVGASGYDNDAKICLLQSGYEDDL